MTDSRGGSGNNIRQNPHIQALLGKLPNAQRDSFSDEQPLALKVALGARKWGKHAFDIRSTFGVWRWRYYFVIIGGREHRQLTRQEVQIGLIAKAVFLFSFLVFSCLFGLLVLYLVKSAMGIDLFPGYSLGIWSWFKENMMMAIPVLFIF